MTRRLLILYTGGTLGMVPSPDGLVPGHQLDERLRTQLACLPHPRRSALPEWQLEATGTPIDSSSATPHDWLRLVTQIRDHAHDDDLSGIVVLHGTDTMAWCSAMLSVWLGDTCRCPVVVTGAQLPLETDGSDAAHNIELAMRYAAAPNAQGVMLAFGGRLLQGDAARKWYTEDHQGFETPNAPLLAYWPINQRDDHPLPALHHLPLPNNDARQRVMRALHIAAAPLAVPETLPRLARIVLWPGIAATQVSAQLALADVAVLEVWGSGNLPDDTDLHQVLEQAARQGKRLIAISQCPHGSTHIGVYAAGKALKDAGIIEGETLTPELASALLLASSAQG
ncbi:asparaginase [Zymobacter sp. IVIA_12111.31 C1]|uniref:asparaginase n=1 Tax=Zymobacter sp. IVIA_12111.31 C1 TaxID=3394854 RepID=UPI0039C0B005